MDADHDDQEMEDLTGKLRFPDPRGQGFFKANNGVILFTLKGEIMMLSTPWASASSLYSLRPINSCY